jgi:hypothetical protein
MLVNTFEAGASEKIMKPFNKVIFIARQKALMLKLIEHYNFDLKVFNKILCPDCNLETKIKGNNILKRFIIDKVYNRDKKEVVATPMTSITSWILLW